MTRCEMMGKRFAKRLLEAGNDVTLFRVPGMMHGIFVVMGGI